MVRWILALSCLGVLCVCILCSCHKHEDTNPTQPKCTNCPSTKPTITSISK